MKTIIKTQSNSLRGNASPINTRKNEQQRSIQIRPYDPELGSWRKIGFELYFQQQPNEKEKKNNNPDLV